MLQSMRVRRSVISAVRSSSRCLCYRQNNIYVSQSQRFYTASPRCLDDTQPTARTYRGKGIETDDKPPRFQKSAGNLDGTRPFKTNAQRQNSYKKANPFKQSHQKPGVDDKRQAESNLSQDHIPFVTNRSGPYKSINKNGSGRSKDLRRKEAPKYDRNWKIQKDALKEKLKGEPWNPRKKLSPDAMDGIRSLHAEDSEKFSTKNLASQFKVSAEAIRRILRSKWKPSPEKLEERRERWAKRHDAIWDTKVVIGLKPPREKDQDTEDPDQFEKDLARRKALGEI